MFDSTIFRAYDIRGIYPSQINESAVYDIAQAYASIIKPRAVVVGQDVRLSSHSLCKALTQSFVDSGVEVIDIGVVPTDVFYFAVKHLSQTDGGIMVSASHNPREWNGLKISKKAARPISSESGLFDIRDLAMKGARVDGAKKGKSSSLDLIDEYADFVLSFINPKAIKQTTILANGNFGVSAEVFRYIVKRGRLPITIIGLDDKPDGNFPKGAPNPLLLENRNETSVLVREKNVDLGVAWDADGDRCFFVDEKGNFIEGYFITALLAKELLAKRPGSTIIIDPRLVWASQEAIINAGGTPIITRAGAALITERMEKENAIFAGEMSSHFYFKENANRDNGIIPLLLILEMMAKQNKTLSELVKPFTEKYFISGEINFLVATPIPKILVEVEKKYTDGQVEYIDGLSVAYKDWRFNLRPSNTEPLLRLNIEARNKKLLTEKVEELSAYLKKFEAKNG